MSEQVYSIGELAAAAEVTPRTIRYYTAEGLLPPPNTQGRYAQYGVEHLLRLRVITQLKAAYLPLGAIRERLSAITPAQLAAMADAPEAARQPSSAAEYLADMLGKREGGGPLRAATAQQAIREQVASYTAGIQPGRATPGAPASVGRFPQVLPLPIGHVEPLAAAGRTEPQAGEALGTRWQRIVVAPGVELHVLEPASPEAEQLVAELLALVRQRSTG
jgi:DNA-binding transcriptional MerR regulator